MTFADEMRELSEESRKQSLYQELAEVLKKIEKAALKGERRIAIFPPEHLHEVTQNDLKGMGFTVEETAEGFLHSGFLTIIW